ncbi:hypothetical protein R5R35_013223 [Gryllus longicercus]|uniref:Uncharacterized protein n=1 Tax=Gryllus longicercus TaxID=2509291 RepID=A0AAN9ZIK7_9ORTH
MDTTPNLNSEPSISRNVTTGKSSTHLAGQGQKPTTTRSLAKVDSQKSSPSQKAPEISLDEDYLESSFHQHEQVIAHQREVLQDLSLCEWPMDVEPALRQEMAWEALRRQPPPSQDLLNDMHFDDPHRLYWRVPSIPEQLNLISDDVEESPPEVGSVMQ